MNERSVTARNALRNGTDAKRRRDEMKQRGHFRTNEASRCGLHVRFVQRVCDQRLVNKAYTGKRRSLGCQVKAGTFQDHPGACRGEGD
eukprot:ctg_1831.g624